MSFWFRLRFRCKQIAYIQSIHRTQMLNKQMHVIQIVNIEQALKLIERKRKREREKRIKNLSILIISTEFFVITPLR